MSVRWRAWWLMVGAIGFAMGMVGAINWYVPFTKYDGMFYITSGGLIIFLVSALVLTVAPSRRS